MERLGAQDGREAAQLVYRALTWGLQIPVGVACYLWWRQSQRRAQPATAAAPQVAAPKAAGAAGTDQPATQAPHRQPRPEHKAAGFPADPTGRAEPRP